MNITEIENGIEGVRRLLPEGIFELRTMKDARLWAQKLRRDLEDLERMKSQKRTTKFGRQALSILEKLQTPSGLKELVMIVLEICHGQQGKEPEFPKDKEDDESATLQYLFFHLRRHRREDQLAVKHFQECQRIIALRGLDNSCFCAIKEHEQAERLLKWAASRSTTLQPEDLSRVEGALRRALANLQHGCCVDDDILPAAARVWQDLSMHNLDKNLLAAQEDFKRALEIRKALPHAPDQVAVDGLLRLLQRTVDLNQQDACNLDNDLLLVLSKFCCQQKMTAKIFQVVEWLTQLCCWRRAIHEHANGREASEKLLKEWLEPLRNQLTKAAAPSPVEEAAMARTLSKLLQRAVASLRSVQHADLQQQAGKGQEVKNLQELAEHQGLAHSKERTLEAATTVKSSKENKFLLEAQLNPAFHRDLSQSLEATPAKNAKTQQVDNAVRVAVDRFPLFAIEKLVWDAGEVSHAEGSDLMRFDLKSLKAPDQKKLQEAKKRLRKDMRECLGWLNDQRKKSPKEDVEGH